MAEANRIGDLGTEAHSGGTVMPRIVYEVNIVSPEAFPSDGTAIGLQLLRDNLQEHLTNGLPAHIAERLSAGEDISFQVTLAAR
jgi:hypothetical protein